MVRCPRRYHGVLRGLQHIAWAVREIERMHPSADILMRMTEEEIEINGYRVPKDWLIMVSPAIAHRLPGLFKEPERFDPLRYAPPRISLRSRPGVPSRAEQADRAQTA